MPSLSKVCFFFEQKGFALKNRTSLKAFIESIFRKEKKKLSSLNYIFCSDKRLLEINQQYLGHDYFTDIISFDLSDSGLIMGEIYISIDRVRDNARSLGVSFNSELHRVIFHGALHLCDYEDKSSKNTDKMRKKEDHYLAKYFK